ncbi:MAG: Rieske 2Fe-2S domain-containing protein [Thaumarchaeota archaeon]|nr:Rieske 2Fe-2S domain-containing protein [Nitrososphaerota archaeon]
MSAKDQLKKSNLKGGTVSKSEANRRLSRFQIYIGIALLASASFGIYLLVTDKSLWLQAVSHAYGLVAICAIDIVLGAGNLLSQRRLILPSFGWAVLTILLQIGDIATASQYHMSVQNFATYLFGLWAFDSLLAVQGVVLIVGLSTRSYSKMLVKKKRVTYFDMGLGNSRRDFIQIGATIGGLFALAAALGAWVVLSPPASSSVVPPPGNSTGTTNTSNLPSGAVANVRELQAGVPAYFDYPTAGYTNMLMKKANGTVSAISILCTHVCCQCQYQSATQELYCPCHGSVFDQNGNVLNGPASSKLPSVQLTIDSNGNIFPVKIVGSGPCVQGS